MVSTSYEEALLNHKTGKVSDNYYKLYWMNSKETAV